MERDLEPQRVVVGQHPAASIGQDPALGRAAAERLDDLLDVEARPDGEDDALGDAQVGAGEDDLVDGLDRLTGADRSDVGDGLADRRQHGPGALDVRGVTADEDRQGRLLGALAAARDGGIDHRETTLAQACGEVPAARRGDRRAVDDERALAGAVDDALLAEDDRFDVRRVRHADHDDVRPGRDGRRRLGDRDAGLDELRGAAGGPVPADDREAGTDQVGGHRRAHRAESHEADAFHDHLPRRVGLGATLIPAESDRTASVGRPDRARPAALRGTRRCRCR